MTDTIRHALAACLLATALPAAAAAAGGSTVSLTPVCVTKTGAALFFMEYVDDCSGASRHCHNTRWAYAAFKPGSGWEFEQQGDAALDDDSGPESNVQSMRQLFKAPAAHTCVSYPRVARVRAPDLPDSDTYFQYSVEAGEPSSSTGRPRRSSSPRRPSCGAPPGARASAARRARTPRGSTPSRWTPA